MVVVVFPCDEDFILVAHNAWHISQDSIHGSLMDSWSSRSVIGQAVELEKL